MPDYGVMHQNVIVDLDGPGAFLKRYLEGKQTFNGVVNLLYCQDYESVIVRLHEGCWGISFIQ